MKVKNNLRIKKTWLQFTVIASLFWSCKSEPEYRISFCSDFEQQEQCDLEKEQFQLGQRVDVKFEFGSAFKKEQIIGKICRITERDTIVLGEKIFKIEGEEQFIIQNIPFQEFGMEALGTFMIRFEDGEEKLLAKRDLSITSS